MPWFIAVLLMSILFVLWALVMAGTVSIRQLLGIPYVLTLPIAAIMPLVLFFFAIVISDTLYVSDRRPYEN